MHRSHIPAARDLHAVAYGRLGHHEQLLHAEPVDRATNTSNQPINSAAKGSTVDFAGNGFSASSTITSVKIGTTTVAITPSPPLVNAQGTFSGASFVVPSGLSVGSYTVTVTDSSGKQATAPLSIT